MADDRPLETPEDAIAALRQEQADQFSTLLARMQRKPVGDVEIAFRGTPKPGTLFLQGQQVLRTEYPDLWAWAQESGSVVAGGYTVGNGSTTFGLPDARGRTIVGAGGTYVLGATGGADSRAIALANLPSHDHNVSGSASSAGSHSHSGSTGGDGAHGHSGSTGGGGSHGGHRPSSEIGPGGSGAAWATTAIQNAGDHSHSVNINSVGDHSHSLDLNDAGSHDHDLNITESSVGSGTPLDLRQPYLAANLAVWH